MEGLDYARLEVSSPGLDRPLKHPADYERFAGLAVQLTLKQPFKGRKNWQGVLTSSSAVASAAVATEALISDPTKQPAWALVIQDGKTEQVLGFTLDEVREARLVPVVNFKGRKAADGSGVQTPAAAIHATEQDGG